MKKYLSQICFASVLIIWIFTYVSGISLAAVTIDKKTVPENTTEVVSANVGQLENVIFAKLAGKERIHLVVSQQPIIDVQSKINGNYLIKLENMSLPERLSRTLGEGELSNIIKVTPSQQLIKGKQWVYLNIDIKKAVPYAIRQEGQNLLIDFNVSGLAETKVSDSPKSAATRKVTSTVSAESPKKEAVKKSTDRIISIDFQDADIKSVLRLMAEYGNISIVTSEDIKGNITLSMKNVPWTQALDTILDVNSLAKRQEGNVIIVTTLAKSKQDAAAKEDEKNRELKMKAEKGLLKQILIEAKIVEATEDFVRNIGVNWGFGNQNRAFGNNHAYGLTGGSNTIPTRGYKQDYPSVNGTPIATVDGEAMTMAAVNFPTVVASPAIGMVFGGAHGFIEAQLAALETNSTGKIISSPKVVTMEGVKATIKQGEEVPYKTVSDNSVSVSFKEALLKLEVTPKITPEGKISMDITASNDYPDWSKTNTDNENPPIVKNEVQSKLVVNDGDTFVIGGVFKSTDTKSVGGWPWLQSIPVLGWLFKTEKIEKEKRQLLIFVTPKVLNSVGESAEKIIN